MEYPLKHGYEIYMPYEESNLNPNMVASTNTPGTRLLPYSNNSSENTAKKCYMVRHCETNQYTSPTLNTNPQDFCDFGTTHCINIRAKKGMRWLCCTQPSDDPEDAEFYRPPPSVCCRKQPPAQMLTKTAVDNVAYNELTSKVLTNIVTPTYDQITKLVDCPCNPPCYNRSYVDEEVPPQQPQLMSRMKSNSHSKTCCAPATVLSSTDGCEDSQISHSTATVNFNLRSHLERICSYKVAMRHDAILSVEHSIRYLRNLLFSLQPCYPERYAIARKNINKLIDVACQLRNIPGDVLVDDVRESYITAIDGLKKCAERIARLFSEMRGDHKQRSLMIKEAECVHEMALRCLARLNPLPHSSSESDVSIAQPVVISFASDTKAVQCEDQSEVQNKTFEPKSDQNSYKIIVESIGYPMDKNILLGLNMQMNDMPVITSNTPIEVSQMTDKVTQIKTMRECSDESIEPSSPSVLIKEENLIVVDSKKEPELDVRVLEAISIPANGETTWNHIGDMKNTEYCTFNIPYEFLCHPSMYDAINQDKPLLPQFMPTASIGTVISLQNSQINKEFSNHDSRTLPSETVKVSNKSQATSAPGSIQLHQPIITNYDQFIESSSEISTVKYSVSTKTRSVPKKKFTEASVEGDDENITDAENHNLSTRVRRKSKLFNRTSFISVKKYFSSSNSDVETKNRKRETTKKINKKSIKEKNNTKTSSSSNASDHSTRENRKFSKCRSIDKHATKQRSESPQNFKKYITSSSIGGIFKKTNGNKENTRKSMKLIEKPKINQHTSCIPTNHNRNYRMDSDSCCDFDDEDEMTMKLDYCSMYMPNEIDSSTMSLSPIPIMASKKVPEKDLSPYEVHAKQQILQAEKKTSAIGIWTSDLLRNILNRRAEVYRANMMHEPESPPETEPLPEPLNMAELIKTGDIYYTPSSK